MRETDALRGRVALVTGAASGIGRSTAIRLAADGAVVGCLDRDAEGLATIAAEITRAESHAMQLPADVTDPSAVRSAVERLMAEHGPVGIVVNNAGVPGAGRFVDITFEDWRRVLDVHVDGTFHVTRAVLPAMISAGWAGSSTSRRRPCGSATRASST